jgi:hypothetical protein
MLCDQSIYHANSDWCPGDRQVYLYCHVCVTNNKGFWVRWLDLLALLYNFNQLRQLTINGCLRLAPFLTRLRVPSLPLWRMPNEEFLLTHWTALNEVCLTNHCYRVRVRVRVRITLRLVVYRQPVRLCDKPLETHDHNFYFTTEDLRL